MDPVEQGDDVRQDHKWFARLSNERDLIDAAEFDSDSEHVPVNTVS